jgi:hypothetical protein
MRHDGCQTTVDDIANMEHDLMPKTSNGFFHLRNHFVGTSFFPRSKWCGFAIFTFLPRAQHNRCIVVQTLPRPDGSLHRVSHHHKYNFLHS